MKPLKIVIIAYHIYPHLAPRSFRATELSKELARKGHCVTLYGLNGEYNYSNFTKETGVIVKNLGSLQFGLMDSDGNVKNEFLNKIIRKLFERYTSYPRIMLMPMVKKVLKQENHIDYLITIAAPHEIHWGASFAPLSNIKCWTADCGDPYMGDPFARHPFYFKYIETHWCRKADFITVPIEEAKSGYYEEFRDKMQIIPQGFDFSNISLSAYKKNKIPTFAYAGNIYARGRNNTLFMEYLCDSDKDFKFIVYTKSLPYFEKYAENLGEKLELRAYVPREILLKELSQMDFLINIRNDFATQKPSKLIDYYLTQRPILEIGSTFDEKAYFDEFLSDNYIHQLIKTDISKYDISNVADHFLDLYIKNRNKHCSYSYCL